MILNVLAFIAALFLVYFGIHLRLPNETHLLWAVVYIVSALWVGFTLRLCVVRLSNDP